VLIDETLLPEIGRHSALLTRCHPTASFALMRSDDRVPIAVRDVFAAGVVRGVLPMNLKLDVWLSVLSIVLKGGKYYPLAMFKPHLQGGARQVKELEIAVAAAADGDVIEGLEVLTERELQILEMVSRGLQNKNIAAVLSLSEYTVKIHLHHIITKLGAHNRTQAAAIFRDRKSGQHNRAAGASLM
jgi:DNA-binding NarL/FixJ family response regulator